MALSGSAYTAFARHRLVIEWSATQSIANNQSTVTARVYLQSMDQYGQIIASATNSGSVTVNGETKTFTANSALSANQKKLLTTQTFIVQHDADGSKSFNFSATYNVNVTFNGVYYGNQTASGSGTLNDIPRASTITTFNNFTIGNNIPWAVDRKHSAYVHRVELLVGSTVIASSDSSSDSGTLGITQAMKTQMLNLAPKATTLTATLRVRTYTNSNYTSQVGATQTKNATGTVGSDIVPDFTTITHSEYVANVSSLVGAYVRTKSRLNLAITGAVAGSGSTIKSYRITTSGYTINAVSGTTGVINNSGTVQISATVTDNRDRTVTKSINVSVLNYSPPKVESVSFIRSESNGNADPLGNFVKVSIKGSVSSLVVGGVEKNKLNYQIKSKRSTETSFVVKTSVNHTGISYNGSTVLSGYPVDYSYNFIGQIGDIFESSLSAGLVPVGVVLQHWAVDSTSFGMLLPAQNYNVYVGQKGLKSHGRIIDKNDNEIFGLGGTIVEY